MCDFFCLFKFYRTRMMKDQKVLNSETLKASYASIFISKISFQESQVPEIRKKGWSKEDVPLTQNNQVREHFRKFDIHKPMTPDGIHPQVLKKLVDVILRPLSVILGKSWWLREVS